MTGVRSALLATTAVTPLPRQAVGGPGNPQRLLTARGRYFVGRMPSHVPLEVYVRIRAAMVRAAYQARIRPVDAPPEAIGYHDLDVSERPDAYPPEYRALIAEIGRAAGGV